MSSPHLRTGTDPVSEMLCLLVFLEYWMIDKAQKPSNSENKNGIPNRHSAVSVIFLY
jgi:hypothetical protein